MPWSSREPFKWLKECGETWHVNQEKYNLQVELIMKDNLTIAMLKEFRQMSSFLLKKVQVIETNTYANSDLKYKITLLIYPAGIYQ